MKVVIDVPDKVYEMVMNTGTYGCYRFNSTKAIREGTPLDKIKAEIEELQTYKMFAGEDTVYIEREDILQIIDKYKVESEEI